ncbi:MAG: thioredoxin domain-containing protein [Bacteroidales bacterium]|nr:thioredoxin domain-containing protein [Bacteroidales bacterium]
MKQFLIIGILAITLHTVAQNKGIQFHNDTIFENVLAKAKAENKLIFIDCYAVWCGPCKYMDANIFPDEELGKFHNANFINLKYDMEKPYGAIVRKTYGIKAYPSFLYLNGDGEVVHRAVGSTENAADFLKISKLATDSENNFKAVDARITKGDRSAKTINAYLDMNYGAPNADALIEEYFAKTSEQDKLNAESWQLISNHVSSTKSPAFAFFVKNRAEFEKRYGKQEVETYLYNLMAVTRRKDPAAFEAMKSLDAGVFERLQQDIKKREAQRNQK